MMNNNGNPRLSFCGIMTAISAALALLMNIFPFNTVFLLIAMSVVICIVTEKTGALYAFCTALATTLVMLLVTWQYDAVVEYALVFGTYPIVKFLIESKIKSINVERLLKTVYFVLISSLFMFITIRFLGGAVFWGEWFSKSGIFPYLVTIFMVAIEWVYDFLLTRLIYIFNGKFRGRI